MDQTRDQPAPLAPAMLEQIAGAPISWGACEVPGWGPMPASEDVLVQMRRLGLRGTELGAPGFLPREPGAIRAQLDRHGLDLVGSFVPLILHDRDADRAARATRDSVNLLAESGGQVLVVAAVEDEGWSAPRRLDDDGWRRLGAHADELRALAADCGITFALHPHAGTLIETADQVQRALAATDAGWCLDTGHLLIGGTDPVAFACEHGDRVTHVHLKDVDAGLAGEVRTGRLSLLEATRRGIFLPLGRGDARIHEVLEALREHDYGGWLVLEQDTTLTAHEPAVRSNPMLDAQESIAFVHNSAHETEEIDR